MNGRITKTAIFLLLMMGNTHVIYQFKGLDFLYLMILEIYIKRKVNLKPFFSLLFFHPRFLTIDTGSAAALWSILWSST